MNLNQKQEEAKNKINGPLLIIAGAGSGKTATLTARVNYMIKEKNIEANSILMVTFTNKAAKEMQERICKTLGIDNSRNFYENPYLPKIGTFHSIGIYFLKECLKKYDNNELNIGLKKDFVIYDESDKLSVLKSIIKNDLGLEEKQYPARQIAFFISNAKNALITAKGYEAQIDSQIKEIVHQVYIKYEEKLRQNNAMDFDDILVKTLSLLKIPQILEYYQEKYKYLMIDEYQDTNAPQYEIVRLLASKYRNLAVVGDDAQCLTGNTKIQLEGNINKKIADIKIGDNILSYDGENKSKYYKIDNIYKNKINDDIFTIKTKKGYSINSTAKHIFFASPEENFKYGYDYGVYLMYKHNVGYRMGFTRFKGLGNNGSNIYGLRKRLNGEQADKAWILITTNSQKEAKYYEQLLSIKYSIPQTVFTAKGKLTELEQNDVDNIFKQIDTTKNAEKLLNHFKIDIRYPHIIASASNRFNTLRVNVNFLMMGGSEKNRRFGMYRVTLHSSHKIVINLLQKHFPELCRKSKLGIRIDKELADYDKIWSLTQSIYKVLDSNGLNTEIIERLSYIDKSYLFLPASNLQKGFGITLWNGKKWVTDKIINISQEKQETYVYDLDINRTHNFVANNFLVHNSIYSWRGADMRNILNFRKDYPEALIVKLEQNYRSTKNIIAGANGVIQNNNSGMKKELWTDNVDGGKIIYIEAPDDKLEASIIAGIIEKTKNDFSYSKNLILYRTNAQSRQIEEALMIKGIPYRVIGGQKFYDRKEIKDLLSYLRSLHNNSDIVAFKRIINTPTRKIGAKSVEILDNYRENFGLSYFEIIKNIDEVEEFKPAARKALIEFGNLYNHLLEQSTKLVVSDLIREIIKVTKYEEYITEGLAEEEKQSKRDNIDELVNVASEFNGFEARESLSQFLEEVALITDMDKKEDREEYVTLMTIHTSKGLEQDRVFVTGLEESIFPSFRSVNDTNALEEERRLMYVAMTRARQELYISRACERFHFGDYVRNQVSRFIKEIPQETIENYEISEFIKDKSNFFSTGINNLKYQYNDLQSTPGTKIVKKTQDNDVSQFNRGDKVEHPKFGSGLITSLNGELAEIAFPGKGIKKMNIRIAPVRKI